MLPRRGWLHETVVYRHKATEADLFAALGRLLAERRFLRWFGARHWRGTLDRDLRTFALRYHADRAGMTEVNGRIDKDGTVTVAYRVSAIDRFTVALLMLLTPCLLLFAFWPGLQNGFMRVRVAAALVGVFCALPVVFLIGSCLTLRRARRGLEAAVPGLVPVDDPPSFKAVGVTDDAIA